MEIPKYLYFRVRVINKGTRDFSSIGVELEDASDVDVVEVVRCKDCIRYAPFKDVDGVCLAHNTGVLIVMSQNGYCNLGERREDVKTD